MNQIFRVIPSIFLVFQVLAPSVQSIHARKNASRFAAIEKVGFCLKDTRDYPCNSLSLLPSSLLWLWLSVLARPMARLQPAMFNWTQSVLLPKAMLFVATHFGDGSQVQVAPMMRRTKTFVLRTAHRLCAAGGAHRTTPAAM